MFPFFQASRSTQTHFLVRAAQNRRVQESEEELSYALTRASKEPLTVWVIRVWEEQAPEGEEPLEWILLTSAPTTLAEAWERVDWYRCRWSVEDYHHCLKSGCRIEERQGPRVDGLMRRLGSVVAAGRALVADTCLRSGRPRAFCF
jgi:hypothetical protein